LRTAQEKETIMVQYRSPVRALAAGALLAIICAPWGAALAEDGQSNFKVSGFMSIVAGRLVGASIPDDYAGPLQIDGHNCPCYTADWANAGVYEERLSLRPESRAGIQLKYSPTADVNLVGQVVVRGSDTTPNIQWAYASYTPTKNWEFQAGRKRIPLYFYSDFQDIGVAFPWVTVPPELYGWEATNYNGASVRYKGALGDANITTSLFAGKEKVKDSLYQRLYYDGQTQVNWDSLVGADFELNRGALTLRGVYMQADVQTTNVAADVDTFAKLRAYGIAANLDLDEWFVLSELTQLTRDFTIDGYRVTAPAYTIGAGYHWGNWTPFLNLANYKEKTDHLDLYAPQSFRRASLTLRYDLDTRSAVKAQIDRETDVTRNFGGNATILRIAYDRLF
jgi:hypothetical protein